MAQQIVTNDKILSEFARLADLLQEASVVARRISKTKTLQNSFWVMTDKLQSSFSDLNEKQVNNLVSDSVKKVRTSDSSS